MNRRTLVVLLGLAFASPALAHSDHKFTKGPHGGHMVDAGGGKQHWELVAKDGSLVLYVADAAEKDIDTAGSSAEAQVLVGGKSHTVALTPGGANTLKGAGPFTSAKGMKVIVKTSKVGGESFQARMTPLQ